jgi:hypothetical protein
MATLRLELAKEEAINIDRGEPSLHQTSPSTFLQLGLDLEDQQCVPLMCDCFSQSLISQASPPSTEKWENATPGCRYPGETKRPSPPHPLVARNPQDLHA